jgi:hypothetical protein
VLKKLTLVTLGKAVDGERRHAGAAGGILAPPQPVVVYSLVSRNLTRAWRKPTKLDPSLGKLLRDAGLYKISDIMKLDRNLAETWPKPGKNLAET